jgi:hypothetical protein
LCFEFISDFVLRISDLVLHEGSEMLRMVALSVLGCLGLLLSGCGPTANTVTTYPVKGTVKVDGVPLASGRIIFEDAAKGITNPVTITNGEYEGQAAPGDLKARVFKVEKMKNPMSNEEMETESPLKSDISVTIQTGSNTLPNIDINSGGP